MGDIFPAEDAPLAVFEPFVAHLVTADLELPHLRRNAAEVLSGVDVHFTVRKDNLFNLVLAGDRVGGDEVFDFGGAQEVQVNQFFAEFHQFSKEFFIACEGQAREVDFEKLGVTGAVGGAVEDGVSVVENVFRAEGGFEVALPVGDELEL